MVIEPLLYYLTEDFSEGLARVFYSNPYNVGLSFIDINGETVLSNISEIVNRFSEGLASIMYLGPKIKSGFINKKGEIVIEPKFFYAGDFSEGLAPVAVYVDE